MDELTDIWDNRRQPKNIMPLPILSDGEGIKLCVTYPQTFSSEQEEEEILENGHYLCNLRLSHIRDKY